MRGMFHVDKIGVCPYGRLFTLHVIHSKNVENNQSVGFTPTGLLDLIMPLAPQHEYLVSGKDYYFEIALARE